MAKNPATDTAPPPAHIVSPELWRPILDAELDEGIAALSAFLPKKTASGPSWTRRLARMRDGSAFLLVLQGAPPHFGEWHPGMHNAAAVPMAFTLTDGVRLLQAKDNPEVELARRLALTEKYRAEQAAKRKAAKDAEEAAKAARAKTADEERRFHSAKWSALPAHARALLRFALAIADREPELAADLRLAVAASLRPDDAADFPRAPWWEGIDLTAIPKTLTVEEEHIRAVLASIPSDRLIILRALHGPDDAKIAQHWKRITEQRA